jgi:hypothetical protein
MELRIINQKIEFEKELNPLDKFVIDFTSLLNKLNLKYAIVSGYVAVLFGRNRSSEDVDIILEKIDFVKFEILWEELSKNFECIITEDSKDAYNNYLLKDHAIRFSKKGNCKQPLVNRPEAFNKQLA